MERCKEIISSYYERGEIIEVRGEDVPLMVSSLLKQNKKVIGITGEDLFKEFLLENKNTCLTLIKRIPWEDKNCLFGKPTLCLLGAKEKSLDALQKNLRVCINKKYSKLAKKYLARMEDKGFTFEKIYLSGATEQAFESNLSDLVIDVVCSGNSAQKKGLAVYDKILSSDIVIIGGKE